MSLPQSLPNALVARLCRHVVAIALCLGNFALLPALAQESGEIIQCLRASKYVSQAATAQVKIEGASLRVSLYQDPRAHIKDLKINSVLLGKELTDAFPHSFDAYVFSYFPVISQNLYTEVTVAKSDLLLFAAGKLSNNEVLARVSLEPFLVNSLKSRYQALSYGEILNYCDDANAKAIKERISTLKANGYDVQAAERQFLKMEDLARNKDEAGCEEAKYALAKCLDESVLQKSDAPRKIRLANERALWPR